MKYLPILNNALECHVPKNTPNFVLMSLRVNRLGLNQRSWINVFYQNHIYNSAQLNITTTLCINELHVYFIQRQWAFMIPCSRQQLLILWTLNWSVAYQRVTHVYQKSLTRAFFQDALLVITDANSYKSLSDKAQCSLPIVISENCSDEL